MRQFVPHFFSGLSWEWRGGVFSGRPSDPVFVYNITTEDVSAHHPASQTSQWHGSMNRASFGPPSEKAFFGIESSVVGECGECLFLAPSIYDYNN